MALIFIYVFSAIPSAMLMWLAVSAFEIAEVGARTRLLVLVTGIPLLFTPIAIPFYRGAMLLAAPAAFTLMMFGDGWPGIAYLMTEHDLASWNTSAPVVVAAIACLGVLIARALAIGAAKIEGRE